MKTTLSDRSIGAIAECRPSSGFGRSGSRSSELTPEERRESIARMAAEQVARLEGRVEPQGAAVVPERASELPSASGTSVPPARAQALAEVMARVDRKFPGKLELGAPQAAKSVSVAVEAVCRPELGAPPPPLPSPPREVPQPMVARAVLAQVASAPAACAAPPERKRPDARRGVDPSRLHRNQRRALLKFTGRELGRVARAVVDPREPARAGVWSTEDYRRIRAAVQDTSGRAAICVLYQIGSEEAVRIAQEVDPRIPRDRRRVALALAIVRSPGGALGPDIKMGYALGLFSKVLADPNNPNMERRLKFCPGRRTLSSDLTWLQQRGVLRRYQVPLAAVDPVEMKQNALYPTNRYLARVTRRHDSMLEIARALGDVPPALKSNPSEQWSDEDAAALAELRACIQSRLAADTAHEPPS